MNAVAGCAAPTVGMTAKMLHVELSHVAGGRSHARAAVGRWPMSLLMAIPPADFALSATVGKGGRSPVTPFPGG